MSEIAPHRPSAVLLPPAAPAVSTDEGVRQVAMLVYGLYLGSFIMPPAILGGLMLAYMNREAAPNWLKSHFTAQIRGFWLYLAYLTVSILLCAVLIGFGLIFVVMGWFITRQIMGLGWILKGEAHPRPKSWLG
jgi:uncharacterized membrane protein